MSDQNTEALDQTASQDTPTTTPVVETQTAPAETAVQEAPVEAPVVQEPAPAPAPAAAAPQQVKKGVQPVQAKPAPAPAVEQKLSTAIQLAIETVRQYVQAMAPRKPMSVDDGCRQQVALYRAITTVINRAEDDFQPAFTTLIKLFEEHSEGALAETHVFRFMDNVTLPEEDRRAFQRLINLIKVAGPVKGRELAVKQIDFSQSLKYGLSEQGRQRVLAYFGK